MAEDQNRTFQDKFMLRFPEGMRDRIRQAADENGRSMNAEIIHRLEQTFAAPETEATTERTQSAREVAMELAEELAKLPQFIELARGLDRIRKEEKDES
ncbi:Arc family DNA-binding protein [Rhizobium sp. SL86]|uniref:Arc family DNA-binding protein n=1 Tax=Rhizobium sp. SL86 TaxID=2995148 RepID=UPI0022762E31|nr:Arc family DNA-binding protein [Rhizobium sp. SL86]MCY1664591.1 Arc family DNA-binding protein [Rhizobium sp. SL86]